MHSVHNHEDLAVWKTFKFIFIVSIRCEPILDKGHVRDGEEGMRSDLHSHGAHTRGFTALGYP